MGWQGSGKFTVTNLITSIFGRELAMSLNSNDLVNQFVLETICKARVLIFPDLGAGLFSNETVNSIPPLTGGDWITVQTKNVQNRFSTRF